MPDLESDLYTLAMSEEAQPLMDAEVRSLVSTREDIDTGSGFRIRQLTICPR